MLAYTPGENQPPSNESEGQEAPAIVPSHTATAGVLEGEDCIPELFVVQHRMREFVGDSEFWNALYDKICPPEPPESFCNPRKEFLEGLEPIKASDMMPFLVAMAGH
jgi:hypothetical protein